MATALRPLTTGELLDRTFSLYRSHFALFLGIFALPHLAVLAFQCLRIVQRPVAQLSQVSTTFAWTWGILLLILIVSAASQAATVVAVSNVYLGRPAGIMDSFSKVKGQIAGIVGLSLSIGLLIGLGFIALIAPGVLLAIRWSLAIPVKVLEGKGVGDSMSRSSELTKAEGWVISSPALSSYTRDIPRTCGHRGTPPTISLRFISPMKVSQPRRPSHKQRRTNSS